MNKIYGVCFSPAGKTAKVVKQIIRRLSLLLNKEMEYISITTPEERKNIPQFNSEDIVVVGTPTYAGRVPNKIMPFITENIKGNGAIGAAIVTYGNRSFDDSIIELVTILKNNNFKVIGSGTFVAEHSFAESLAKGRPDENDLNLATELAEKIAKKINKKDYTEPDTPGNKEYDSYYIPKGIDGKPAKFLKAVPFTDKEKCTLCGTCSTVCPMGSIKKENNYEVKGICIKCQACIKNCTQHAKFFTDEAFLSHKAMLQKNFAETDKHSEIYL